MSSIFVLRLILILYIYLCAWYRYAYGTALVATNNRLELANHLLLSSNMNLHRNYKLERLYL